MFGKKRELGETLSSECAGAGDETKKKGRKRRQGKSRRALENPASPLVEIGIEIGVGSHKKAPSSRVHRYAVPRRAVPCRAVQLRASAPLNEVVGSGRLQVGPTCVWSIHSDCRGTG